MTNALRSRLARPLVLAAAAVLVLGACGGDDDGADGDDAAGGTTTSVFPTIPPVGTTATTLAPGQTTVAGPPTTVAPGQVTFPPPPSTTVPGATTVAGTDAGVAGVYTVLPNDYLAGIADKLNVDYDALLEVNGFTADTVIHPGDKIKVPAGGGSGGTDGSTSTTAASGGGGGTTAGGTYTVEAGDCWVCIAEKLGVDYDDLLSVNGATADTVLIPGQEIKVPTGSSDTTAAATTTTTG
jgi:LysM repeat protein